MGIATYIEGAVDTVLTTFVNSKSSALCGILAPLALTGVTIYILLMGWAIMRGETKDSLHDFLKEILKITFISSIALGGGIYQSYVVNGLEGIQGIFTQAFAGVSTIGAMIDQLDVPFEELSKFLWQKATEGTLPSWSFLIAAIIVNITKIFIFCVAIGMYILAKVALAITLAVGPFFILCAMFPTTKRLAESWLGQALTYVFYNMLIAATISFPISIASQFVKNINNNQATVNPVSSSIALAIVSVTMCFVILNIKNIASALGGGASLVGRGREIGRGAAQGAKYGFTTAGAAVSSLYGKLMGSSDKKESSSENNTTSGNSISKAANKKEELKYPDLYNAATLERLRKNL